MEEIKTGSKMNKEITRPEDFTDPEQLYDMLLQTIRRYHPSDDLSAVEKAYRVAYEAHKGQYRKSGESYIIHPLCVAIILAELELDKETIIAGLLHDVVEDTDWTDEQIRKEFGEDVANLVDGVTKLGQLSYSSDKVELQAENLRKMFLAMAKDIRVILIKLADRLHNMRTLQYMKPEKQKEKSRETMDIYAPIAHRLGISKVKTELDDLALRYLNEELFEELKEKLNSTKQERTEFINQIVQEVRKHIEAAHIKAEIDGRVKHFFSIYKKMVNQNKTLDQIYDIFAVRIKVETVIDCYAALGVIHEMYTPIPGRFKDYIAMPKQNMYQSLHTTVIGPDGQPFEVQIRTYEMHRIAEYGIAAHWKYKENAQGDDNEEEKLSWLRQILEWQTDMSNNHEFLNLLKTDLDLFQDTVYCFTPSGDVKALPTGSNTIDFAYSIHSAVGNKMVGARINGRQVPIETKLQNGDRVEIVTSQNSKGPSRDWLLLVKSTQAKNKINNWFKTQFKEENIVKGKELMERYCKAKGYAALGTYLKPEYVEKVLRKYSFKDWDSLCASVGHGGLKEGQVVNKLIELYKKDRLLSRTDHEVMDSINEMTWREKGSHAKNGIVVEGADDVSVRFSKCCSPVPGDEIIGFITRGRGISIHRTDCVNIINISESDKPRLIEASWQVEEGDQSGHYSTELVVYANNRVGLMVDITRIFSEENVDIISVSSRTSKQGIATINVSFYISGTEMLNRMIQKIRGVESVIDIERSAG